MVMDGRRFDAANDIDDQFWLTEIVSTLMTYEMVEEVVHYFIRTRQLISGDDHEFLLAAEFRN